MDFFFLDINGEEKVVQKNANACLDRLHAMCPLSISLTLSHAPTKFLSATRDVLHTHT